MRIEQSVAALLIVAKNLKIDPKSAGLVMIGFIDSLVKEDHLAEIQVCAEEAESLEGEVMDAI